MRYDPRLANLALLRLAAYRLTHGPPPLPPLPEEGGLCNLLQYAARYGVQPAPEVDEYSTGLGALLYQARQMQAQQEEGHA